MQLRDMLVNRFVERRTARGSHKGLTSLQLLQKLVPFVVHSVHSTLSHLNHVGEADTLQCPIHLSMRSIVLGQNSRSHNSYHLFTRLNLPKYIKDLRDFKDSAKWTSIDTRTAIDTAAFINVLNTMLILLNSTNWARSFTRHRDIYNSMVGASTMATTATNAVIMINLRLTIFLKTNALLRAGIVTCLTHTATAEVGDLIIDFHTTGASLVNNTEKIVFLLTLLECLLSVV